MCRLKPEAFSHGLAQHKDREFVDRIVAACTQGVDIGYRGPRLYHEHENWPSVYKHAATVKASIEKDTQTGVTIGPFTQPPFQAFVGSPMGCFKKKHSSKYHVVHDLSYPPGQSINHHIDIDEYRMHYMSLDDVVSKVQQLGQNALLTKLDLESAYKHIPIRRED